MSTTHFLPYTRFTRQVRTSPMALLATAAAAAQADALLRIAPWVESTDAQSTIPARDALRDGAEETFDAYKFCGNYASGYQRAYAGMAAYRFRVPADALTGPDHVVSVALPLHVDRWLVDGARVAAYVSAAAEPSADWATLREGAAYSDAELPMEYTEDDPPVRIVVDKSKTLTITLPANTDALAYLYVVVSLEDYATVRGFWIEGGAMLVGADAVTTFNADVTADDNAPEYYAATGKFAHTVIGTPNIYTLETCDWYARASRGAYAGASDNSDYIPISIASILARRQHAYSATPTLVKVHSVWLDASKTRFGYSDALHGARCLITVPGARFTRLGFRAAIPATSGAGRVRLAVYSFSGQSAGVTPGFYPVRAADSVLQAPAFWSGTAASYVETGATPAAFGMAPLLSVLLDPAGHASAHEWPISLTSAGIMTLVYALHVETIHPPAAESALDFKPGDIFLS